MGVGREYTGVGHYVQAEEEYAFTGQWEKGERTGRGVLHTRNGMVYDGEWRADQMSGRGTLSLGGASGDRYEGEFSNGMFEGQGQVSQPRKTATGHPSSPAA
jgi:hypothetical protein